MAQVWVRTHSITSMRHAHCGRRVSLLSLRRLHFPLFPHHLLSYHPVLPSDRQLHLPGCGGQIPCALPPMRQNINQMWKVLKKEVDFGEPTSSFDHVYVGCTQRGFETSKDVVEHTEMCLNLESQQAQKKNFFVQGILTQTFSHGSMTWKVMQRSAWKDIANWRTKLSSNCTKSQQFKEERGFVGEVSKVCSQIVLKCLYLARIGRPDNQWSVNTLARAVTKWTRACDKRLVRLISEKRHTSEFKQYCHAGNTAHQCRLGLFQNSDFAGDLEDSKSTSDAICAYLEVTRLFA